MSSRLFNHAGLVTASVALMCATVYAAVVSGPTFGDWELPSFGNSGYAVGKLVDGTTNTSVFKMKAKLTETPSPSLTIQNGLLVGELDDGIPGAYPHYTVSGSWTGNRFTGIGSFEALIYRQVSPLGPIALIGKMKGGYDDAPSFGVSIGEYKGEWKADL